LKIAINSLGNVDLPVAIECSKYRLVLGFEINSWRVFDFKAGSDSMLVVTTEELKNTKHLTVTSDQPLFQDSSFYFDTAPTPIDVSKQSYLIRKKKYEKCYQK